MPIKLFTHWSRRKLFATCIFLLLGIVGIRYYLNNLHQQHENTVTADRCLSELKSYKYQLGVVTEYKDRLDKLLTDTQKYHETDKDRFRDVVESCYTMKQQSVLCQNQFDDLQQECKKLRVDYERVSKELEKLKSVENSRPKNK